MFLTETQVYMSLKLTEDITQRNIIDLDMFNEAEDEYHNQDFERNAKESYMREIEKGNAVHENHSMSDFQNKYITVIS